MLSLTEYLSWVKSYPCLSSRVVIVFHLVFDLDPNADVMSGEFIINNDAQDRPCSD